MILNLALIMLQTYCATFLKFGSMRSGAIWDQPYLFGINDLLNWVEHIKICESIFGRNKNILFLFYFSHFHWIFLTLILHIIFCVFVTNFTWIVIFSLLQRTDLYWTFSAYATKFICFHNLKPYANWFNNKKFHFPCSVILVLLMRKLLSFLLMKNMYFVSWFSLDPKVSCQKLDPKLRATQFIANLRQFSESPRKGLILFSCTWVMGFYVLSKTVLENLSIVNSLSYKIRGGSTLQ